jgi:hypothetical protein
MEVRLTGLDEVSAKCNNFVGIIKSNVGDRVGNRDTFLKMIRLG